MEVEQHDEEEVIFARKMSENKKEQYRKDNDQNDFRAMLDKAAKVNTKNKEKKQEIKLSPVDTLLLTQEEKKKPEFKINP